MRFISGNYNMCHCSILEKIKGRVLLNIDKDLKLEIPFFDNSLNSFSIFNQTGNLTLQYNIVENCPL